MNQNEMFHVEKEPGIKLNTDVLDFMIIEIANEILNKPNYRNYLLNTSSTYTKTIKFITTAISYFEREEKYEICAELIKFKRIILEKIL